METFIEKLKDNVDALESADITPDTDLTSLEDWDSIALLSVMSVVASEYGVNLKGTDIIKAATPSAIFALINKSK